LFESIEFSDISFYYSSSTTPSTPSDTPTTDGEHENDDEGKQFDMFLVDSF